jgi:CHAD domain-containing protein
MPKRLKSPHIWTPEESAEANARFVLPAMAREYFANGRKMVKKQTPASELHPFRLDTKRFRYTLEVFRDLYGPTLDGRLEKLKPVQDALGEVNDCVATRAAFDQGKKFDKFLKKRAAKKASKFYKVWESQFDALGEEEAWVMYLSKVETAPLTKSRPRKTKPQVNGHDADVVTAPPLPSTPHAAAKPHTEPRQ